MHCHPLRKVVNQCTSHASHWRRSERVVVKGRNRDFSMAEGGSYLTFGTPAPNKLQRRRLAESDMRAAITVRWQSVQQHSL